MCASDFQSQRLWLFVIFSMSIQTGLAFIFTILASVSIVAAIILLGKAAETELRD